MDNEAWLKRQAMIDQCKKINWYSLSDDQLRHVLEIAGETLTPSQQEAWRDACNDVIKSGVNQLLKIEKDAKQTPPGEQPGDMEAG